MAVKWNGFRMKQRVIQAVHQGGNVFMTGSAGTGKSFVLRDAAADVAELW
ncbi:hypothetical protein T484DRAFT_1838873 [Baffinella frigidus]|nr:hypothetical protein T484DRAFT_1838873 [Cryptophyta sp. CCMP2293]